MNQAQINGGRLGAEPELTMFLPEGDEEPRTIDGHVQWVKKAVYRCYRCGVWFYAADKCRGCGSVDIGPSEEITKRLKEKEGKKVKP